MKTKTNHTFFFKAMVLVLAFALAVLCAPIDALVALAQMSNYTDYSYMTIGKFEDEIKTTVTKGNIYTITEAYIGGNNGYVVGRDLAAGTALGETSDGVEYVSSSVTVKYASQDVAVTKLTDVADNSDYGTFIADKLGTYTITYSYEYSIDDGSEVKTYKNKYELKVNSVLESASISLESNEANFIPSIIDLGQLTPVYDQNDNNVVTGYKDVKGNDKTFVLPKAAIKDEDGDEISADKLTYVRSTEEMTTAGKYVLVTVKGGQDAGKVTLSQAANHGDISIPMATFADPTKAARKYTVTYALYEKTEALKNPYIITSTSKSFEVESDYYGDEDYDLKLDLASSWSDSAQTGIESSLPAAKGVTSKETVDVFYTVKVYHSTNGSINAWTDIATKDIYADVLENGYLKDASKFKPLEDGYYTFEYEITDFYGNKVKSQLGTYEFTDVKDKTNPTPVVYDASQYVGDNATNEKIDEDYKVQTRSNPNAPVVVYAIGIKDNVESTEGVELTRKIVTSDTVTKLTITTHNDKNLVFNYTNTNDADNAYDNLISNNYVIREQVGNTITNDTAMLNWLKGHNYMVVVDDVNAAKLYNIFNNVKDGETSIFADVESVANADTAEAKEAAAIAWLKSDASASKGFAYISSSETFGATGTNGMGTGSYKVHYIAKDAAGNSSEVTKSMSIYSYDDTTAPDMKFATTLADTYLPDATITFDAPTASDNYDTNMLVKTMYRYLDADGKIVDVKEKVKISTESVASVKTDLGTNVDKNGTLFTEKYSKFFTSTAVATQGYDVAGGYIDLTDESASNYTIDLSEAGSSATKLQIVTFAYDDCGNVGIYAEEINISNATDNAPPAFGSIDANSDFRTEYVQGEEIELPSFTAKDDAAAYMSYEVNVYHVANDGTETKISTYDSYSSRNVQNNGIGTYTVYGGKFVASFAGTYKASIAVKDSKNKSIVSFIEYNVASRNIVQPPVISTSIESKTVELDDAPVISIPTPTVNYEIADSVLYSELTDAATETYVVMGVDENNKATNWSTNHGQAHSFKPTEIGEYNIQYNVKLTVYNRTMFTYEEMTYDKDNGYVGGYFTLNGYTTPIEIINENEFKVTSLSDYVEYFVVKDEDGNIDVLDSSRESVIDPEKTSFDLVADTRVDAFADITALEDFETWFKELKLYSLNSETYTIIAQDTKGPVIAEYDYDVSMSTADLADEEKGIEVKGIEATDLGSGINAEKSKIVVSWKLANGESGTQTYDKVDNKNMTGGRFVKSSTGKNYDGIYKITYTVYDNNNNYTTKEYTIAVGDNVAPTVTMKEDVLLDKYNVGTSIEIKLSDIDVKDNKELNNTTKTVTLTNTSTDTVIEDKGNGDTLVYELSEVGSYTLTVEVEDAVGNKATETYEFEVVANTQDATMTYKIVGTVLIVVSVLILAGVIVYFVVSKVKLDKELKK